jgi:hypothetical protein
VDVEQMLNAIKLLHNIPEDLYQIIEDQKYNKLKEQMEK